MRIGIVGAGMAGLACAAQLARAGMTPVLFDKGSRPGGRMSTWQTGQYAFDYGAQYFTARDDAFADRVAIWVREGVVAPWVACGSDAYVGVPGMSAPVAAMARQCDVRWGAAASQIHRDDGQWWVRHAGASGGTETTGPFDAVVMAIPAEQAVALLSLHDMDMAREAMLARSQPCLTGMFAFAERIAAPDILRNQGPLAWAARDSSKPGRGGAECWVVQAAAGWSQQHLEMEREAMVAPLLRMFAGVAGVDIPEPVFARAHRWRFAMTGGRNQTPLWNAALRLGACGDWRVGPRVECAWQSGAALADMVAGTMGAVA